MLNIIGLYWRVYKAVQHFEPWGILFAVLGLAISIVAFWLDHEDRVEARTVNAWNLLTTQASGNSGKIAALEYLNRKDGLFCGASGCMITLKKRAPLPAINLAGADPDQITHLSGVNLPGAELTGARLAFTNLFGADLSYARLGGADLTRAILKGADLRGAHLQGAILTGAILDNANLSGANLEWSTVEQPQLISACGNEQTMLAKRDHKLKLCPNDWQRAKVIF